MEIIILPEAKEDLIFWEKTENKAVLKKITNLIKATIENPYEGIGKPEQLKYDLAGNWSRRINREHRFVYEVEENKLIIHSLKGHYK
ncbi:MAG: toxin YoeB [Spirosomataceae bacterium]|jgi:toxin YoeB